MDCSLEEKRLSWPQGKIGLGIFRCCAVLALDSLELDNLGSHTDPVLPLFILIL